MNRWPLLTVLRIAVGGLVLAAGPCCVTAVAAEAPIAKAGAVELSVADLRRLIDALPEQARRAAASNPAALSQAVRSELVRRLVLEEARSKGFDRDPAVTAELDRLRDEIVVRQWVARSAAPPAGFPSEEEVQRAYQVLRDRAASSSDYRVSQIFIAIPDGAAPDKVQAALRKSAEVQAKLPGGDFAALAKTYSDHAESAARGGDLGLQAEARLLPEIRTLLAGMKPGETAGPVKTSQGVHFLRLVERKAATVPPLAEVHDNLVAALRQERTGELQQRYLADITQKSPPTLNELELAKLIVPTR